MKGSLCHNFRITPLSRSPRYREAFRKGRRFVKKLTHLTMATIVGAIGLTSVVHADDDDHRRDGRDVSHVLLISVDGMHAQDLANYVGKHPQSHLARLSAHGFLYPKALTSAPSDSFPGLLAQVTGGTPKSTGVFYDNSYDRTLFAPGSNCTGPAGANTLFDESIDNDTLSVTGGGTLGQPLTQINPAKLPRALVNGSCVPVYPHSFVKVNTIFEVIRGHGRRTAWSDKHPAYDLVNGPSGKGVQDLFTPEVDSNDSLTGQDTTTGFHSIERNDMLKVKSILNEIAGFDSNGVTKVGVPAIFGMNFQSVSVGQKLAKGNTNDPSDAGLIGGYADAAGAVPNNGLQLGLDFVDTQIGAMISALQLARLEDKTLVIVSAKHGQSPVNLALRAAFDDGPYGNTPGIGQFTTDDVGLVWLAPGAEKADYSAARSYLQSQAAKLGIDRLLDADELARLYGSPFENSRTPDFVAVTKPGLIYTGGTKLAEHGGFTHDDRNVALLVAHPSLQRRVFNDEVETRQIAPTILNALGIDADELKSVREEHTRPLPGFGD
jgi:predicted AlkP superfamily pyrophosphatase or phosphodiesterase